MRTTHTYVVLELSSPAFAEIKEKLEAAGYQHAFNQSADQTDGRLEIDMQGIAVADDDKPLEPRNGPGYLQVGTNESGEVIVNLPADMTGHLVFTPAEARGLAVILVKQAAQAAGISPFQAQPLSSPFDIDLGYVVLEKHKEGDITVIDKAQILEVSVAPNPANR